MANNKNTEERYSPKVLNDEWAKKKHLSLKQKIDKKSKIQKPKKTKINIVEYFD